MGGDKAIALLALRPGDSWHRYGSLVRNGCALEASRRAQGTVGRREEGESIVLALGSMLDEVLLSTPAMILATYRVRKC